MPIVMCNTLHCPYCQFCVFELDCSADDKYAARLESEIKTIQGLRSFDIPDCFQDANDLMMITEENLLICDKLTGIPETLLIRKEM